jgi:hypothetical protein
MAKCVCSEAEVECKCGCGCFCIHGETEEDFECITMCYKCPEPKTGAAGLRGTVLGFDAWIDRRARRRRLGGQTKISIRCREAPLGSLAMALEKIAGVKLAVPTSRLAAKRTVTLTGRVDDIVKRLGIIRLDERQRTSR